MWYAGDVLDLELLSPERLRPLRRAEYGGLVGASARRSEGIDAD
jgi:hypothetical protein